MLFWLFCELIYFYWVLVDSLHILSRNNVINQGYVPLPDYDPKTEWNIRDSVGAVADNLFPIILSYTGSHLVNIAHVQVIIILSCTTRFKVVSLIHSIRTRQRMCHETHKLVDTALLQICISYYAQLSTNLIRFDTTVVGVASGNQETLTLWREIVMDIFGCIESSYNT